VERVAATRGVETYRDLEEAAVDRKRWRNMLALILMSRHPVAVK
jgi:hypothetical protein